MEKYCPKCDRTLDIDAFARSRRKSDGLQAWCRSCKKTFDAAYYQDNKSKYETYNKTHYAKNKERMDKIKSIPCVDCGGTFPSCVMDFDHVDGLKEFNVADGLHKRISWTRLMEEIDKCEVVCANCHRIRTWLRRTRPASLVVERESFKLPGPDRNRCGSRG